VVGGMVVVVQVGWWLIFRDSCPAPVRPAALSPTNKQKRIPQQRPKKEGKKRENETKIK